VITALGFAAYFFDATKHYAFFAALIGYLSLFLGNKLE
jgi:hypothetical protein